MKAVLSFLFFLLSFSSAAEVFKLSVITSEFDQNVTNYFLETNDQNVILSMRYVTTMPDGDIFEDVSVSAERAMSDGIVIVERNGLQVVKLELEKFDVSFGGMIKLNYLFNGVTGKRSEKRLFLKLEQQQFMLFDQDNKRLNTMFLEANRVRIFGIVGVKSILTSFIQPN